MMKFLVTGFTKITGAIPMYLYYRPRFFCKTAESKASLKKARRGGKVIVISNHTTVYDFALLLLTFPFRFLRMLMAEILFKRSRFLAWFLKNMGGIYVDRNSKNLSFMTESINILNKNGMIGMFPEARLIAPGKKAPFSLSAVSIAVKSGAEVLPMYIEPRRKWWHCTRVVIGQSIDVRALCDGELDPSVDKMRAAAETLQAAVCSLEVYLKENTVKRYEQREHPQKEKEKSY